jgi:hypothetical protein
MKSEQIPVSSSQVLPRIAWNPPEEMPLARSSSSQVLPRITWNPPEKITLARRIIWSIEVDIDALKRRVDAFADRFYEEPRNEDALLSKKLSDISCAAERLRESLPVKISKFRPMLDTAANKKLDITLFESGIKIGAVLWNIGMFNRELESSS